MHFSDPSTVARYQENLAQQVPALRALHQMTHHLLAERVPPGGDVLVLGAGGGVEIKCFAERSPDWNFTGVDPSAEMLSLARSTLGEMSSKVAWVEGYIESAPEDTFDGATCLLTLHFLSPAERLRTLGEIRRRLKPGAPFVMAHHSVPDDAEAKLASFERWAAYVAGSGSSKADIRTRATTMAEKLPTVSPEREVALLLESGFKSPTLFYAALTFRGWVAYAP